MATLKFFASVKDRAGREGMEVIVSAPTPLKTFLADAARAIGVDSAILTHPSLLFAINQEMQGLDAMVTNGDEVAVLPPLSGGL